MKTFIFPGYVSIWVAYAAALLAVCLGWNRLSRFLSVAGVALNGCILAAIVLISGVAPVFEIFSGILFATFFLALLGVFLAAPAKGGLGLGIWVWIEVVVLLVVTLFFPKEPPPYRLHHADWSVVMFHGFRCLALASACFAAAHFFVFRSRPGEKKALRPVFNQGRNFLLLSALFFLCAEYAGILWCQNGWGDFWHWSTAFFQSTIILLLLMAAFHPPGKPPISHDIQALLGMMIPMVMLTVTIVKALS